MYAEMHARCIVHLQRLHVQPIVRLRERVLQSNKTKATKGAICLLQGLYVFASAALTSCTTAATVLGTLALLQS